MLDISQLERDRADAEKPVRREVLKVDGTPYPLTNGGPPVFHIIGLDSHAVREASRKAATERALKRREIRKDENTEDADALADRIVTEMMLDPAYRRPIARAALVGWENIYATPGGDPLDYNDANAERILQFDHLIGQIEQGAREHRDFFAERSTDS